MIRVTDLRKTYLSEKNSHLAVRGVSFEAQAGEFLTLLGPSGCGKSTTLRSIAGLETPEAGEIAIGDEVVFSAERHVNMSPGRRRIGMVFQSYAIWPHLTVYKNVEYPLKRQKVKRAERKTQVEEILEVVGMSEYAHRPAPYLSGGQQQRVALARALVSRPRVLLLDEPLSNLDAKLRRELGRQIRELQQQLRLTVLYVTHDQAEAMSMSDRVIMLREGEILENGAPEALYRNPRSGFGAGFLGEANFVHGTVGGRDEGVGKLQVQTPIGPFAITPDDDRPAPEGSEARLMIRPEDVAITPGPATLSSSDGVNRVPGTIVHDRFLGSFWECDVRVEGFGLLRVKAVSRKWWELGQTVQVEVEQENCALVGGE